ncbi:MAG TPA: DedA family protein [Spirochaetota bacterium]|nr:DedA family protein [Spirochaetota bacterium]
MDFIAHLLTDLAPWMPLICFGLLLLAGLNLPVSEDLVFIISAGLAVTITPERLPLVYAGCFAGALGSDIISYGIGRFGGRKLLSLKFVEKLLSGDRVARMEGYYEKYGAKTLLFGRLIPFGMRNLIFMTAGFSRMPAPKFILIDIIPLSVTSSLLFYLGATFGRNYQAIIPWLDRFKLVIAGIAAAVVLIILVRRFIARRKPVAPPETDTGGNL